ncbi:uncharacterized protein LOC129583652 isoform X1 [Paramacrobiotus metropolitanus]|uniref:uncharacterized protein LOC129583652 isoform X1 n=1 Tax=Paramacrobiotus metropolitanus TaxID=2943436 RepID=UPI002445B67C|nr:uncharacterized protein LOC129583652 isoform X1 [Paramacrobiotus metropolitanus]
MDISRISRRFHLHPDYRLCILAGILFSCLGTYCAEAKAENAADCILSATDSPNDQFEIIRTYFTDPGSQMAFALNGPPLFHNQTVRFVMELSDASKRRYSSILPKECDLIAQELPTGSRVMVRIVHESKILDQTGIVSSSDSIVDSEGNPTSFFMDINSININSAAEKMDLSIRCAVKLCFGLSQDRASCDLRSTNFGSVSQSTRLTRTLTEKSALVQRTKRQAADERPVSDLVCVNNALFISLVTGLGALLLVLISADGYYALKALSSSSSKPGGRPAGEMSLSDVPSKRTAVAQHIERSRPPQPRGYPRSQAARAEMVAPRRPTDRPGPSGVPSSDRFYY